MDIFKIKLKSTRSGIKSLEEIILLLGGNSNETREVFLEAIIALEESFGPVKMKSGLYQSPAWGYESSAPYLNQALVFASSLSPETCLQIILQIEEKFGRVRKESLGYEDRTIDIDLISFGQRIIKTAQLEVPHPRAHLRRFVLLPISELLPDGVHARYQKSWHELLIMCEDTSKVMKI